MKVLKRESISPICLMQGDTISLTYTDENGAEVLVAKETLDRAIQVDEAIIFEVDAAIRRELGISDGIGGIFARR